MRRTKIICTVGPASADYDTLLKMYKAGMNVLRLNMSHGNEQFYRRVVRHLRRLRKEEQAHIGLLWDLQGPEIRTGDVDEPYEVEKGEKVCLTTRPAHEVDKGVISVSYDAFSKTLSVGDSLLIDNGNIKLKVLSIQGTEVRCEVLSKGTVRSRMHVNLTGKQVALPPLSQKDLSDLRLGVKLGADWVALSFVRSPKDIKALRTHLEEWRSSAAVMAKIEHPQAVEKLSDIIQESDGVMVARGDLGAELPFDAVPNLQNEIVAECRLAGKPVVVATHMLESMMQSPMPTRAEATDVAHAVATEVDATMLSGETAVGDYVVDSVKAMAKIIDSTEDTLYGDDVLDAPDAEGDKEETLLAAASLANKVSAAAIVVFTQSGETARLLVRNRPNAPVIAFAKRKQLCHRLHLLWGVLPQYLRFPADPERTIAKAMRILRSEKLVRKGAKLVLVSDTLLGKRQRVTSILLTKRD